MCILNSFFNKISIEFKRLKYGILDRITKKSEKIILIGANAGKYLNGNALAIYNFLSRQKNLEVYFFSYQKIKGIKTINENTKYGLKKIIKSKYALITHGPGDLGKYWNSFFFTKSRIIIQMWHGIPLKTLGLADKTLSINKKEKVLKIAGRYNFFISSSVLYSTLFSASYGIDYSKFILTGFPRNDYIFIKKNESLLSKYYSKGSKKKYFVLYAPTFREWEQTVLFPFNDFDKEVLEKALIENNIYLFIRFHINEKLGEIKNLKNIIEFNVSIQPDINIVLNEFDALLTDYSSIYFDFLLTGKPIGFIPYDLEIYSKKRGFYFNYNSITPGKKIHTFKDLIDFILSLKNTDDPYRVEREKIRDLFFEYRDNKSCERIFDFITQLNEK